MLKALRLVPVHVSQIGPPPRPLPTTRAEFNRTALRHRRIVEEADAVLGDFERMDTTVSLVVQRARS